MKMCWNAKESSKSATGLFYIHREIQWVKNVETFNLKSATEDASLISRGRRFHSIIQRSRFCHQYFLGKHTRLNARVYTEKIPVTRGMFHGIQRESVAKLVCIESHTEYTLFICLIISYLFIVLLVVSLLTIYEYRFFSVSFISSANMNILHPFTSKCRVTYFRSAL